MQTLDKNVYLGIIGQPLAGKRFAVDYLVKQYGAHRVTFSDILKDCLALLSLDYSRENLTSLATNLRNAFGEDVLIPPAMVRASEFTGLVIFDGIRKSGEFDFLVKQGAKTIHIVASIEVRYQRYLKRQEKADDGIESFKVFQERELSNLADRDILKIGEQADFIVVNEKEPNDLYSQLDKLMQKI